MGFAYIAGGAHTTCKASDGAEGECPELDGGSSSTAGLQYYINDVAQTADESGFGLDACAHCAHVARTWRLAALPD